MSRPILPTLTCRKCGTVNPVVYLAPVILVAVTAITFVGQEQIEHLKTCTRCTWKAATEQSD